MIKVSELYKGDLSTLPPIYRVNLEYLSTKMTQLRKAYGEPMIVTSGFRTKEAHERIYKNTHPHLIPWGSAHLTGQACDISDKGSKLWYFCRDNFPLLQELGLYLEDPRWTHGSKGDWMHFQTTPPRSGKRVFIPNTSPPLSPKIWNGVYDPKFDRPA